MKILRKLFTVFMFLVIAFVSLIIYCSINDNEKKVKGLIIKKALKSYQSDYGRYPDSIQFLSPRYYDDQKALSLFESGSMTYWPDSNRQCFRLGIPASLMDYWILTCNSDDWEYQ